MQHFLIVAVLILAFQDRATAQEIENGSRVADSIRSSVDGYNGSCPCPYNTDIRGVRCGQRSAYSKAGGVEPICYPPSFTQEMREIADTLILESVNEYEGSCPCPYNKDVRGFKCGERSAYSRVGGAEPLCYSFEVTEDIFDRR